MAFQTVTMWEEVTLTVATTGYSSSVELPKLGKQGTIFHVLVREDATLDKGSTATLIISTDSGIDANTTDEDIVYESDAITLTGSATAASLLDNLHITGLAKYHSAGPLYAALNVTVASGGGASTSVEVRIAAEVQP